MNFPVLELRDEEGNATQFSACLHGRGVPQICEVTCGGSTHLSCKRVQIKMRDYMDRRVTLSPRVTSPTRGPPLPCKQALNDQLPVGCMQLNWLRVLHWYRRRQGSNPSKPEFFRLSFRNIISCVVSCDDLSVILLQIVMVSPAWDSSCEQILNPTPESLSPSSKKQWGHLYEEK